MLLRGGSSKGLYFKASDLPADGVLRNRVLLAAMCGVGPEDKRQIDGLGGADPLTSKVAVIGRSTRVGADLDYEFVQVVVGGSATDGTQNCGNILAGVVPFAIESGLLRARDGETSARVYMTNSESICEVVVQTPGGRPLTAQANLNSSQRPLSGTLGRQTTSSNLGMGDVTLAQYQQQMIILKDDTQQ